MSQAHIGIKDSEETKVKKALKAKLAWDKRKALLNGDPDRCNATNCDVENPKEYLIVNNTRYCSKHGQRLKRTGSLEMTR